MDLTDAQISLIEQAARSAARAVSPAPASRAATALVLSDGSSSYVIGRIATAREKILHAADAGRVDWNRSEREVLAGLTTIGRKALQRLDLIEQAARSAARADGSVDDGRVALAREKIVRVVEAERVNWERPAGMIVSFLTAAGRNALRNEHKRVSERTADHDATSLDATLSTFDEDDPESPRTLHDKVALDEHGQRVPGAVLADRMHDRRLDRIDRARGLAPTVRRLPTLDDALEPLSDRDRQVLAMLARGATQREIGEALGLTRAGAQKAIAYAKKRARDAQRAEEAPEVFGNLALDLAEFRRGKRDRRASIRAALTM